MKETFVILNEIFYLNFSLKR